MNLFEYARRARLQSRSEPFNYKWIEMPYDKSRPKRVRGVSRVFHRAGAGCVRGGNVVEGRRPPDSYMPCATCFSVGPDLDKVFRELQQHTSENTNESTTV